MSVGRTIYAGRQRLVIPDGWTTFIWHARRYRLADRNIEVWDLGRAAWLPSMCLTTSAPKGRRAA